MAITERQEVLLNGLELLKVEREAMIGIALTVKEPEQTEKMIDFLVNNPKATESEILLKAAEIHNQK